MYHVSLLRFDLREVLMRTSNYVASYDDGGEIEEPDDVRPGEYFGLFNTFNFC